MGSRERDNRLAGTEGGGKFLMEENLAVANPPEQPPTPHTPLLTRVGAPFFAREMAKMGEFLPVPGGWGGLRVPSLLESPLTLTLSVLFFI